MDSPCPHVPQRRLTPDLGPPAGRNPAREPQALPAVAEGSAQLPRHLAAWTGPWPPGEAFKPSWLQLVSICLVPLMGFVCAPRPPPLPQPPLLPAAATSDLACTPSSDPPGGERARGDKHPWGLRARSLCLSQRGADG